MWTGESEQKSTLYKAWQGRKVNEFDGYNDVCA